MYTQAHTCAHTRRAVGAVANHKVTKSCQAIKHNASHRNRVSLPLITQWPEGPDKPLTMPTHTHTHCKPLRKIIPQIFKLGPTDIRHSDHAIN